MDYLAGLAKQAEKRVSGGYYDNPTSAEHPRRSLVTAIAAAEKTPIIAEIKFASPSLGKIRPVEQPLKIARAMLSGGAVALSVLTDPDNFQGRLDSLSQVSEMVNAPIVMKDIIVSPQQIRAAAQCGADAIVLISELFSRELSDSTISEMLQQAKQLGLEVIVESHGHSAFEKSRELKPDLYGINNRDLSTFEIDISTTERVLHEKMPLDAPVVSESGIESANDVRRLQAAGAKAFLIGTSIMRARSIEDKVGEFVNA